DAKSEYSLGLRLSMPARTPSGGGLAGAAAGDTAGKSISGGGRAKAAFDSVEEAPRSRELSTRIKSDAPNKRFAELKREYSLGDLHDGIRDKSVDFFAYERKEAGVRPLYRNIDATQEWAEDNYYHLPIGQQVAGLVGASSFWLDYARYDGQGGFLSTHFADASHNFTEMMFALAVLDLPFEAGKHPVAYDGGRMTYPPAGPVIAFHEEVRPVSAPAGKSPILISQNVYRLGDRFRMENGEKADKFVTGEFLSETVYGTEVVVTNSSSARQKLAVLVQLPTGAVPVAN